MFLGSHKDVRVEADTGREYLNHAGAVPLNFFIIMLRATSKNAFVRQMPRSWEYMVNRLSRKSNDSSNGGFLFSGYNAVDFSTKDSLVALMSGLVQNATH